MKCICCGREAKEGKKTCGMKSCKKILMSQNASKSQFGKFRKKGE